MPKGETRRSDDTPVALPDGKGFVPHLTDKQRRSLRDGSRAVGLPPGGQVFARGDKADALFLVAVGKVKIEREGIGGKRLIVRLAGKGDAVGARALLAGERHSSTATALCETTLLRIGRDEVELALRDNAALSAYAIRTMAVEARTAWEWSAAMTQKQIRGRLATALLALRRKFGYAAGSRNIGVGVARKDLAALSNMTVANAIRTLSQFAAEGVVEVGGRDVTILDEEALTKIARMG